MSKLTKTEAEILRDIQQKCRDYPISSGVNLFLRFMPEERMHFPEPDRYDCDDYEDFWDKYSDRIAIMCINNILQVVVLKEYMLLTEED